MQTFFPRIRTFTLLPAILLLAGCVSTAATSRKTIPSTSSPFINAHALIIVRHADINIAEKKTLGDKAPLVAQGEARAKELAYALQNAGINRIITSETLRTQETAAVLATQLHLTPETPFSHGLSAPLSPSNTAAPATVANSKKQEALNVIAYLAHSSKPDDIILLVHHHSVIPGLLNLLGYPDEAPFVEDAEFDRVYVVIPDPAHQTYHIMRLRYGGAWGTQHADLIHPAPPSNN